MAGHSSNWEAEWTILNLDESSGLFPDIELF